MSREKIAGRALLLDPELIEDLPILFDFMGLLGSRPAAAAAQPRGPPALAPRPSLQAPARPQSSRGVGQRDRGPALDGRGQRRAARRAARLGRGHEDARDPQLPARVLARAGASSRTTARSRSSRSAPADTSQLLRDLVGEDPSLDGLADLIHERTAGNPFFIEEIVRELPESGSLEGERGAQRWSSRSATSRSPPASRPSSPPGSTGSTPTRSGSCRRCRSPAGRSPSRR